MQTWIQWQREVVAVIRQDLAEVIQQVSLDDVDWPSWERFFSEGHSAQSAVNRAFERAL